MVTVEGQTPGRRVHHLISVPFLGVRLLASLWFEDVFILECSVVTFRNGDGSPLRMSADWGSPVKWRKHGLGSSPAREDVEPWLFAFWTDVVIIRLCITRKKVRHHSRQITFLRLLQKN